MRLSSVLETLAREEVIADLSLSELAGQSVMGRREEIRLMGVPFFKNVFSKKSPDPVWLSALDGFGMMPKQIIQDDERLDAFSRVTMVPQFKGDDPFFDLSKDVFDELYAKDFLLFSDHGLPVPRAIRAVDYQGELMFPDGLLIRTPKSAQGDSIKFLDSAEKLILSELKDDDLLVEYFPEKKILKNLEIIYLYQAGRVEMLGVIEIVSKKFRKIGSRSVQLSDNELAQIESSAKKIELLLLKKSVEKLIFGIDAFLVEGDRGETRLVIYDFNPCITQGFFSVIAAALLKNKWGGNFDYEVRSFSIFVRGDEPLLFDWSSAFPLFMSKHTSPGALFQRLIMIGLFPVIPTASALGPACDWIENLKAHSGNRLYQYSSIHY